MAFLKAWLSASVLLISREKISLPASAVKGVSGPRDWAMPALEKPPKIKNKVSAEPTLCQSSWEQQKCTLSQSHQSKKPISLLAGANIMFWRLPVEILPIAIAVFPVPGWPAISIALPAMWPSLIISKMTPAARREANWPTIP